MNHRETEQTNGHYLGETLTQAKLSTVHHSPERERTENEITNKRNNT